MNLRRTLVTAGRVLAQLRGDHRTIALMLVVPCVLHRAAGLDLQGHPGLRRASARPCWASSRSS